MEKDFSFSVFRPFYKGAEFFKISNKLRYTHDKKTNVKMRTIY